MFRRDPFTQTWHQLCDFLGQEGQATALLPLARALVHQGGVIGVAAAGRSPLIVSLGTVPTDGVFEVASLSKAFTAALADALIREERLSWNTPLHRLGGPLAALPRWFTPLNLATHTAGLPPHPVRAAFTALMQYHDPYATLSPTAALNSARRWATHQRPPRFMYSNLGVGVLGLALAHAVGEELSAAGYAKALAQRVTGPLGLGNVTLSPFSSPEKLVTPAGWLGTGDYTQFGSLAAAGGLYGTASDLLAFAQAHLSGQAGQHWQLAATPLWLTLPRRAVAPGWFVSGPVASPVLWHDGLARGTRCALGFNPVTGQSAVLLLRGGLPLLSVGSPAPAPAELLVRMLGGEWVVRDK